MKMHYDKKIESGIGLIEVLVTTVVFALGLLAVASFQTDLIQSSRGNKTKAECFTMANAKMEELRSIVEKTGYTALASSTTPDSLSGVTETFTRSWTITDLTAPTRKQISVNVSWGGGSNAEQCEVQSVIAFNSPVNSSYLAQDGSGSAMMGGGPSTNAESSDEISEYVELPVIVDVGSVVTVGGQTYIAENVSTKDDGTQVQNGVRADLCNSITPALTEFENNLSTRRIDFDLQPGKEAIELFQRVTIGNEEYCISRVRFNGGVIIPVRGIVYSGATVGGGANAAILDVNLFTFNTSETGTYCVFDPPANARSAPYVCYVGGNCEFGPAGTHDINGNTISLSADPDLNALPDTIVTECPAVAMAAAKVGPGGWRGKVGLLGIALYGKNVCFAEEIAGEPLSIDSARNYYSRNAGLNEGINKPYICHDFLIIDGQTTEPKIHQECVERANDIGGFTLASKTIQRNISGNNIFDPYIGNSFCGEAQGTDYSFTGDIVNANSAPQITVTDSFGVTEACTSTTTTYSCLFTSADSSATVTGVFNNETVSCDIANLTPNPFVGCTLTFTPTENPTYTITGNITGNTNGIIDTLTLSLSEGGFCSITTIDATHASYSCAITLAPDVTTANINATTTIFATVDPTTSAISLSGEPITGPDFTVYSVTTYTVSGTINIGNNVSNLSTISVQVDKDTGECSLTGTHDENTIDTFSCSVIAGANHLHVTLSDKCSPAGGSKKYGISDGSNSTLGEGSLVIDLGTVGSNISKTITITKSSSRC